MLARPAGARCCPRRGTIAIYSLVWLSLSLYFSLSPHCSLSLSPALSHTHSLTHTLSHTHSPTPRYGQRRCVCLIILSLSFYHSLSHTYSLSLTHTLSLTLSLPLFLSLSTYYISLSLSRVMSGCLVGADGVYIYLSPHVSFSIPPSLLLAVHAQTPKFFMSESPLRELPAQEAALCEARSLSRSQRTLPHGLMNFNKITTRLNGLISRCLVGAGGAGGGAARGALSPTLSLSLSICTYVYIYR